MYAVLRKVQRENKSFALELEPDGLDTDAILFYLSGHKVHFVDLDLPTMTNELRTRVHERPTNDAHHEISSEPAPASDAPTVFMCHAHEDADYAAELSRRLRENQINVWLDKDNLRGGDQWDARIERTLEDEVQVRRRAAERQLEGQRVGYVNKEINLAIGRQSYYRPPRIFLIPAVIDSVDNQLDMLSRLQFVDLTSSDGINQLVRTIKRDVDAASRSR